MKKIYILLIALFVVNDAMAQWFPQNSGTTNTLNSVYFINPSTGYVAGFGENGTMLKTTDSGANWVAQNLPMYSGSIGLYSVYFPKEDTGYGGGQGGWTVKTTDGGLTWTDIPYGADCSGVMSCGCDIFSLFFTDVSTGFSVGRGYCTGHGTWDWGCIYKTNDGGVNWSRLYEFDGISLYFVFFVDDNIGYVVGELGTILKTTDGGIQWGIQNSGTIQRLNSVFFLDEYKGYAVGDSGTIIKTTDGGANWITQYSGVTTNLNLVFFSDDNLGHTVGKKGVILKTIDGGINWIGEYSGTTADLLSVFFTSTDTGYVVGEDGTIHKTTNGGYPVGVNDQHQSLVALNIYPNPASTTITIETVAKGSISIHNINGQPLLQQEITEPITTIDVRELKSGVYFVRVTGEKNVSVGKFIKQ